MFLNLLKIGEGNHRIVNFGKCPKTNEFSAVKSYTKIVYMILKKKYH